MKGFKEYLGSCKDAEIITNENLFENKGSRETLNLVYDQILLFAETLKASLRPPNQAREAGNIVGDVTKYFTQGRLIHGTKIPELGLMITL